MQKYNIMRNIAFSSLLCVSLAVCANADAPTQKDASPTECEWDCHGWWFPNLDQIFSRSLFVHPVVQSYSSMSFKETDKLYTITVTLPDIEKKDISVNIINNVLVVTAKRQATEKTKDKVQKSFSSYDQSIVLPENADISMIDSVFKNSVLTITIPKTGKKTSKKVLIR